MDPAPGAGDWIAYLEGAGALDPANLELRERLQGWDETFQDLEELGILTRGERVDLGQRVTSWLEGMVV